MDRYPKRLIEVDLPIKRISAHARREKYLPTITSLHLWWARRPLAACRAVICAALWPDPADELCPPAFREAAFRIMRNFARDAISDRSAKDLLAGVTLGKVVTVNKADGLCDAANANANSVLRDFLFDFIADFSNWEASTNTLFLNTARSLTQAAHESLGGVPGTRPLVVDPFAGGGSIPLEAMRVGADSFASDLNPVAVLLNKVWLEYVPKYGQQLANLVRERGEWIKNEADKELPRFYPKDPDGATPIAYLWARTIRCEGPGCGAEVPLIRSSGLAKKSSRSVALQLVANPKRRRVDFRIIVNESVGWVDQVDPMTRIQAPAFDGTVKRGAATCPCCGYTTPALRVRHQLLTRRGGTADAQLLCVVTTRDRAGRFYRLPTARDTENVRRAVQRLESLLANSDSPLSPVPDEATPTSDSHRAVGSLSLYGMSRWADIFTPRQALALLSIARLVGQVGRELDREVGSDLARSVKVSLSLAVSRQADHLNSGCTWNSSGQKMQHLFTRQALPMVWDFCETNPFGESVGSWSSVLDCVVGALQVNPTFVSEGHAESASAMCHPLPDNSAMAYVTDPPYYDSVPYAEIADFFYVWLRRMLVDDLPDLFRASLTPKKEQLIVWHPGSEEEKQAFVSRMGIALGEGRRVLAPKEAPLNNIDKQSS